MLFSFQKIWNADKSRRGKTYTNKFSLIYVDKSAKLKVDYNLSKFTDNEESPIMRLGPTTYVKTKSEIKFSYSIPLFGEKVDSFALASSKKKNTYYLNSLDSRKYSKLAVSRGKQNYTFPLSLTILQKDSS